MADAHHTRAHAQWAASATARNTTCAGALAMATLAGPERESEAAAWGTACHQLAEKTFAFPHIASLFIGEIQKTECFEFEVDEEMANTAQQYVDYCRSRIALFDDTQFWIEKNFSLEAVNPPFKAGGTGDCIIYFPRWRMLEIVDLKGGRGVVVEVQNNGQARTYGLGAMLAFPELDVAVVRSTIVQPRAPHADGRVRSEEIHVADLVDWTAWLIERMNIAKDALNEFQDIAAGKLTLEQFAEDWLTTGACTFCPAEGFCPKRRAEALAAAGERAAAWFEDPDASGAPTTALQPTISAERLGHTLDGLEALESWIKAVRGYAHMRAERGETIPGWMLADKIGNRAWIDEAMTAAALWDQLKISTEQAFEKPKLKSVAQMEKTLGAKAMAALEGKLWHKPVKGTNLVSTEKTTRTPALSKAEQHFEQLEQ